MFPPLLQTIKSFNQLDISDERKAILQALINYIQQKIDDKLAVNLNFICTHNSRRSHLSQVWAQTAATYFKIPNVACYSGGTEETALFPKVVEILQNQGFEVLKLSEPENPVYAIKFDENANPIIGFSKKFDHSFNPVSNFAAVMTCSQADVGCPFIAGADKRIPMTFDDPKISDNTPKQTQVYAERSQQIASEMFYVFSKIKL